MKDIKSLQSTLIMIFPADDIHLPSIKRKDSVKLFNDKYNLELNKVPESLPFPQNNILFRNGEYKHEGKLFIINEIIIEERRLIIRSLGPSEVIDDFFSQFRKDLKALDIRDNKGDYAPLLSTYETICVCQLDLDFHHMFNEKFNNYLKDIETNLPTYAAKMSLVPFSFRVRIDYHDLPEKLRKERITLADKFLTIEQREKTDPADKIYFTASPTETSTHFALIDKLEKEINK
ncbi:hypothetical protein [Marispirochaeta sp.]|uniref:hypothetical protein n=1 Tax=Marispirochaeta sp. TaxID=2038653 RepID=UPI0029C6ABE3|nr:hypothetical protein [Marispirochaeta sp.]